jgi:GntR family transcriptional regulator
MIFVLDYKNGVPFYKQIIQQIEFNIGSGEVKPGDKLPTVRSLAIELKINPNTVAKSYNELEIRGLVTTQVGSGTYISNKKVEINEIERKKKVDDFISEYINKAKTFNLNKKDLCDLIKNYKED